MLPSVEGAVVYFAMQKETHWYLQTNTGISILEWAREDNQHHYKFSKKEVGYANLSNLNATMIIYCHYPLICGGVQNNYKSNYFSYLGTYAGQWLLQFLHARNNSMLVLQNNQLYLIGGNTKVTDPFRDTFKFTSK